MSRSARSCAALARLGAAAALALSLLSAGTAWAAPPGATAKEQADIAFDEGRELFEQGRFKEACDKFQRSMDLDPSPGTLLNLGNCFEPQGDLLRALATFEQALADAQKATDRKRRQVWSEAARERIASLSQRIPELKVDGAEPGATVLLDGKPYTALGQALRQNPGRHQLEVSAPGKRPYSKSFELAEGQRLGIHLPPLEKDEPAEAAAAAPVLSAPAPAPEPGEVRQFGYWPYIAGGTGLALLGTSLVTGLMASSKAQQLKDECNGKICDSSLESVQSSARTLGVTTDVLWISGALVLGTGVTLFVLDSGKREAPDALAADAGSTSLQAGCFGGGCGLVARGTF